MVLGPAPKTLTDGQKQRLEQLMKKFENGTATSQEREEIVRLRKIELNRNSYDSVMQIKSRIEKEDEQKQKDPIGINLRDEQKDGN